MTLTTAQLEAMGYRVTDDGRAVPVTPGARKPRRGRMNKLEAAFEQEAIPSFPWRTWHGFEVVKFRLAEGCWYTPDFTVVDGEGRMHCFEVKGSWRAKNQREARVRLKVAAEQYPWIKFVAARRVDGQWVFEAFGSAKDVDKT